MRFTASRIRQSAGTCAQSHKARELHALARELHLLSKVDHANVALNEFLCVYLDDLAVAHDVAASWCESFESCHDGVGFPLLPPGKKSRTDDDDDKKVRRQRLSRSQ